MKKVAYTRGELVAETISAVVAVCLIATEIVLAAGGVGGAVIMVLVEFICYGAFSICSFMPCWENTAMYNPEKVNDKMLHNTRKGCIAAKIIITGALLMLSFI